jgi:hypothetical protein
MKIYFTVSSDKNGKHGIPLSHAGRNERQIGSHSRKDGRQYRNNAKNDGSQNERNGGEADIFSSLHNAGQQKTTEQMKQKIRADPENLKEMMEEMMNANQAKMNENLKEMREETKSGQVEMKSILNAWTADMKKDRKDTMSCQVTTAAYDSKELNPEDRESEVTHRKVPMEEAAVKSLGTMKKRHWNRHLAAGQRKEP